MVILYLRLRNRLTSLQNKVICLYLGVNNESRSPGICLRTVTGWDNGVRVQTLLDLPISHVRIIRVISSSPTTLQGVSCGKVERAEKDRPGSMKIECL